MAISLKSMQYFNTAVDCGSISRAAERLNIAASAVSAAIDQVEATFELTLVVRRRSRGIEANASGRLIAAKFARILEDYHAILEEGADLKQLLGGSLRIGYYAPVAPAFLPGLFATAFPDGSAVTLHLRECDNDVAQDGLINGEFDVILFVSDGARASIDHEVLLKAPPYCLVPDGHPFAERNSVSLAEIGNEPLVVLDRPMVAGYYHQLFEAIEPSVRIAGYANSTEMVRSLVSEGHGCAVLNMRPLTETSYAGAGLVSVPILDPLQPLSLAIAYDRSRPRRVVEHFANACRAYFAADGAKLCVVAEGGEPSATD